jgi:hypothetical protein
MCDSKLGQQKAMQAAEREEHAHRDFELHDAIYRRLKRPLFNIKKLNKVIGVKAAPQ